MNKKNMFMAITLVLCVLLFLQPLTGEIFHAVLGVFFLIVVGGHVCMKFGKMKYKKRSIQVVDWVIMIALVVLAVSGILIHPLGGMLAVKILHKLSAVIFVLGMIVHMIQYRKMKEI